MGAYHSFEIETATMFFLKKPSLVLEILSRMNAYHMIQWYIIITIITKVITTIIKRRSIPCRL